MLRKKNILTRIASLALALVMLTAVFAGCGKGSGSSDTGDDTTGSASASEYPIESEHYKISQDMLQYFFYKDYYDAIDAYYSSYFSYYGLDPTKDLKEQKYSDGSTWFDYFMTITYKNLVNYMLFAEAALDEGKTLTDAQKANVDADIESLESAAREAGYTAQEFLTYRFGEGVTVDTVRSCMELYEFSSENYDEKLGKISFTEDDLNTYYNENKSSFMYVDYRSVQVRAKYPEDADAATQAAAYAEAEAKSNTIASAKNLTEYVDRTLAYLKSINDTLDEPLTDEQMYQQATNVVVEYAYTDQTDFGKWAFDPGRRAGDITMLDNGGGIYTVYYLQTAEYRKENATKNLRRMSFSAEEYDGDAAAAKKAAEEAYAAFEATSRTGEDFAAVAAAHSGYAGSVSTDIDLGELPSVMEAWAFSDERSAGDCALLEGTDTWYIVYFEGDGKISWKKTAENALINKAINVVFDDYMNKYEVTYNYDLMTPISGVTVYTGTGETTAE